MEKVKFYFLKSNQNLNSALSWLMTFVWKIFQSDISLNSKFLGT